MDGTYYYFDFHGYALKGTYAGRLFGDDYKAFTGILEKSGALYYYTNGITGTYGLTEYNGDYYRELYDVVRTFKDYSIIAHLDHIRRYDPLGFCPTEVHRDLIAAIIKTYMQRDPKDKEALKKFATSFSKNIE